MLVFTFFAGVARGFGYTKGSEEFFDLVGDALYPEGILTLPSGEVLVGGFGDGSLQFINGGDYFSAPGENGMVIAVGFAVDGDMLWVANFNFNVTGGIPGSQLKAFSLNGTLVATFPSFEDYELGVFFNEVAVTGGRVYVSDTFTNQIWTATLTAGVEVLVSDDLLVNPDPDRPFGQNGLAATPDGRYLIVSVMDRLDAGDGRLVRVDLVSNEVANVTLSGATAEFAGSDGMFFYTDSMMFMVNVFSAAGAIITADFSDDFSAATLVVRDAFQDAYDRPTASDIKDDRLFTVNSQLNHIIDDNDGQFGTDPELPFQVVSVPLADLLGES